MTQYICADCGNIFAADEIETWRENVGEFWGAPAYETVSGCPYCHSGAIDEYIEKDDEKGDEDDG